MMPSSTTAYISLGSNMGTPTVTVQKALKFLANLPFVTVCKASPLYSTQPLGLRDQNFFINQVAEIACDSALEAEAFLGMLLGVEAAMGRVRDEPNGPRVLDLDLLLFGSTYMNTPLLTLPHPLMCERAFVLLPLADIAPHLLLPCGTTVINTLSKLKFTLNEGTIFQDE